MSTPAPQRRYYLSTREAAETLSVSERTIRRLVAAGRVPAVRLDGPGSAIRIPADGLEDWLWAHPEETP